MCSQIRESHSLPEGHTWTFLAIDGVDGEILWHRLLCPDKKYFLYEENEEPKIFNGYPCTFIGKSIHDTF